MTVYLFAEACSLAAALLGGCSVQVHAGLSRPHCTGASGHHRSMEVALTLLEVHGSGASRGGSLRGCIRQQELLLKRISLCFHML